MNKEQATKKGFMTSEFVLTILALLQANGTFKFLSTDSCLSTADRVQDVANQLQGVDNSSLLLYAVIGGYIYFRNQIKLKSLNK